MCCKCSQKMHCKYSQKFTQATITNFATWQWGSQKLYWKYSWTKLRPEFFGVQGAKVQGACDFTSILKALK